MIVWCSGRGVVVSSVKLWLRFSEVTSFLFFFGFLGFLDNINGGGHFKMSASGAHLNWSIIYRDLWTEAVAMPASVNQKCSSRKRLCVVVYLVILICTKQQTVLMSHRQKILINSIKMLKVWRWAFQKKLFFWGTTFRHRIDDSQHNYNNLSYYCISII
jgi:hypothetical protein